MEELKNVTSEIQRIHGDLYQVFTIMDDQGKVVQHIDMPLRVEMRIKDFLEMIVGSSILAVPVAFTEEVWNMGDQLHWINAIALSLVGILFMAGFVYYSAYQKHFKMFRGEFVKRVLSTFLLSAIIVGFLLTIVGKCPWLTDFDVALKRTLIGAFPASLSATVTDSLN